MDEMPKNNDGLVTKQVRFAMFHLTFEFQICNVALLSINACEAKQRTLN